MAIRRVFIGLPALKKLQGARTDDWVDRFNRVWTVLMFGLFAIIVSTGQFVGDHIHCWCPAQFPASWVDYAKSFCWVKNTYYLEADEPIPIHTAEREDEELTYYQWSILIMLFEAFMFVFPSIIWRKTQSLSGIDLDVVVAMATETQLASSAVRREVIQNLADYLDNWLEAYREYHMNYCIKVKHKLARFCRFYCRRRAGTFLTGLYLSIKIMYAVNVIGQFYILNAFLAFNYKFYGIEALDEMRRDDMWLVSRRFPRVTFCDILVPQLQNVQRWTFPCVLPINRFNEQIFRFVWFWLVMVAFLTCLNLARWLYCFFYERRGSAYIKKCLQIRDLLPTGFDKKLCHQFAEQYLRDDGVFVMRVIARNSTNLVVTDLLEEMWKVYRSKGMSQPVSHVHGERSDGEMEPLNTTD